MPLRRDRQPVQVRPGATGSDGGCQNPGTVHHARCGQPGRPLQHLKQWVLDIFTPPDLELTTKILHTPELGDQKPSKLMEDLLSWLPPGENDGLLFKTVWLLLMPKDISDHLARKLWTKSCRELAAIAGQLWLARCARRTGLKIVAAITKDEVEDKLTDMVAALGVKDKKRGKKKKAGFQQLSLKVCATHAKYKEKAFSCDKPVTCQ